MNEGTPGGGSKGPRSLVDQALHAADAIVTEVQQRMPPELLNQLRAGQRRIDQRISRLQSQLGRSATRSEVDRLARRVDELAAQLEELARAAGGGRARSPRTEGTARGPRSTRTGSSDRPRGTRPSERSRGTDKPAGRSTRGTAGDRTG
ncbi:MAG: hypothetical protein J2P38_01615, partial [Candidatus Dormibacteraeota bacterium]|nr:hypothetical protein [Candidatus Dormibacteraeota bacterium]